MAVSVNAIRNPGFSDGKAGPRNWVWSTASGQARWKRGVPGRSAEDIGMQIAVDRCAGTAFWSQIVTCRPGGYYRVEAAVSCNLVADDESTGFVVFLQPMQDDRPIGDPLTTPGVHRAREPITVRAIYRAPDDVHRLKISIGLVEAVGIAKVHEVRFIKILEPDEVSHVLAIPAPRLSLRAPRVARSVCVCSKDAATRPIASILRGSFGKAKMQTLAPAELCLGTLETDALLLPDPAPPPAVRSLSALVKLAAQRIVIISTPAFVKLSRGTLSLRRIEQPDDPIHAKIAHANYATHGFALHDTWAYAWEGGTPGSFVQNQLRKTGAFKAFCQRHGFDVLLHSMCDQDATSDRPVALFKTTTGGALFVLDVEPAESPLSTRGEPTLAVYLLRSILGQTQAGLGQYVAPVREEAEFRGVIRDMADRFRDFVVRDADVPTAEVAEQLVTIGWEDGTFGGAPTPKPAILVRSGLASGDVASVYGAFLWFKQLVRMPPHACPYAEQLASRFRFAWIPCVAPWEAGGGWRRHNSPPATQRALGINDDNVAALIDIVSHPINRVRVLLPDNKGRYQRYGRWLPTLTAVFRPGCHFAPNVPEGETFCDRDRCAWRPVRHDVRVLPVPEMFKDDLQRGVLKAAGEAVRIEVPNHDADFTAHSIQRTDLVATLLEQVIGLQYGLIGVNRQPAAVQLDGFSPVNPGDALVVDRRNAMLRSDASRAG